MLPASKSCIPKWQELGFIPQSSFLILGYFGYNSGLSAIVCQGVLASLSKVQTNRMMVLETINHYWNEGIEKSVVFRKA